MEKSVIRAKLHAALDAFLAEDLYLLEVNVNERTIASRLAFHLQREFASLCVDCEYNRAGGVPKSVRMPEEPISWDDTDAKTVFPDIVVHQRGAQGPNVLVLELKKENRDASNDLRKLAAYKQDLHYIEAAFIEIRVSGVSPGFSEPRYDLPTRSVTGETLMRIPPLLSQAQADSRTGGG